MSKIVIRNGQIVNRKKITEADLLIVNDRIERIGPKLSIEGNYKEIDATGKFVIPGVIDDQVHFREPGFTHKADIQSESRAAIAGGTTSFMEMPNTNPQSITQELLQKKYDVAERTSAANYSFYMGATNENIEEVLKTNHNEVCGVKIFMGSSTGNMLVDNEKTLENLFSKLDILVATHCEDEETIRSTKKEIITKYGEDIDARYHPRIRNHEACYLSSSLAVNLAKKHNSRLHILHLTTSKELDLFDSVSDRKDKRITAEVCVHHLYFEESSYPSLGNKIICNPAIKTRDDRQALRNALRHNILDVIATDHAPHTPGEKNQNYLNAPSGLPLVQHGLNLMLEIDKEEHYGIELIVDKMSHAVADIFNIEERGYLDEGYFADIVIVDPNTSWTVTKDNLLYKCGWSPFEGMQFGSTVEKTIINGIVAYDTGKIIEHNAGKRLGFCRD